MAHGRELVRFAGALVQQDRGELAAARDALAACLGPGAVTAASIIAGNFSMLDRIANAIGVPVDPMVVKPSADFRESLGINEYPSAVHTLGQA